jgi:hypothetical protein
MTRLELVSRSLRRGTEEARGLIGGEDARPDPAVEQQEHVVRDAHRRLHRHRHLQGKVRTAIIYLILPELEHLSSLN